MTKAFSAAASDRSNSAASAPNCPTRDAGRPMSRSASAIPATAWPSEAPLARSNERAAAGNCSWWATLSGAVVRLSAAKDTSGTWAPGVAAVVVAAVVTPPVEVVAWVVPLVTPT